MVYGTGGFCTELMQAFGGRVIAKRGAAGVYFCGLVGQGVGCAVKLDDGAMGPQYCVTMKILRSIFLWQQLKLLEPSDGDIDVEVSSKPTADTVAEDLQALDSLGHFELLPSHNCMGTLVGHTTALPLGLCTSGSISSGKQFVAGAVVCLMPFPTPPPIALQNTE